MKEIRKLLKDSNTNSISGDFEPTICGSKYEHMIVELQNLF